MKIGALTSRVLLGYGIGALAGALSAFALAFALSHSSTILVLLIYLASVPLFMVGFSIGRVATSIGALIGTAGLFAFAPLSFGSIYCVTVALPASLLILTAMHRHVTTDGVRGWAKEGSLLTAFVAYPCLIFLLIWALNIGNGGGLYALTTDMFDGMMPQINAMLAESGQTVTPEMTMQIHNNLGIFARFAPAVSMCTWLFSTLIAFAVAQGVMGRQGWSLRPTFSLMELRLPNWIIFAAALSGIAASFASAPYSYVGLNLAIVLGLPFLFTGLAVVHAFAARTRWPNATLILFYIVISTIVHLVLVVAMLGAVDQWIDFRKRFAERISS